METEAFNGVHDRVVPWIQTKRVFLATEKVLVFAASIAGG